MGKLWITLRILWIVVIKIVDNLAFVIKIREPVRRGRLSLLEGRNIVQETVML